MNHTGPGPSFFLKFIVFSSVIIWGKQKGSTSPSRVTLPWPFTGWAPPLSTLFSTCLYHMLQPLNLKMYPLLVQGLGLCAGHKHTHITLPPHWLSAGTLASAEWWLLWVPWNQCQPLSGERQAHVLPIFSPNIKAGSASLTPSYFPYTIRAQIVNQGWVR